MRKILLALLVVMLTSVSILFSCKPDPDCGNCNSFAPPVAKAGSDLVVTLPTVNIVLDGSYSTDNDGKITKWLWTKISGPDPHEIVTKDSAKTSVKNLIAGLYQFQLEVTDDGGNLAKDTVKVTVLPENHPPKAVAGRDTSVSSSSCGGTAMVNLNGSGSNDADNDIVTYLWTKLSGPSTIRLVYITNTTMRVENLVAGAHSFELTVIDSKGLSSKDTVLVNVLAATPVEYTVDMTSQNGYVFNNNFRDCYYYYYYGCTYNDVFTSSVIVNLSPTEIFNIYFSEYSDTAAADYASNSIISFTQTGNNKNLYGRCSVNFKKLIQTGGGAFTGTFQAEGGSAQQCDQNIFRNLPLLTVTGAMDTTAKRVTITIKGKLFF